MNESKLKITKAIGVGELTTKLSNYFSEDEINPIFGNVINNKCWTDGNIAIVVALPEKVNFPTNVSAMCTFVIIANETYDKLFDD